MDFENPEIKINCLLLNFPIWILQNNDNEETPKENLLLKFVETCGYY